LAQGLARYCGDGANIGTCGAQTLQLGKSFGEIAFAPVQVADALPAVEACANLTLEECSQLFPRLRSDMSIKRKAAFVALERSLFLEWLALKYGTSVLPQGGM
jgi:hypothetical protein